MMVKKIKKANREDWKNGWKIDLTQIKEIKKLSYDIGMEEVETVMLAMVDAGFAEMEENTKENEKMLENGKRMVLERNIQLMKSRWAIVNGKLRETCSICGKLLRQKEIRSFVKEYPFKYCDECAKNGKSGKEKING